MRHHPVTNRLLNCMRQSLAGVYPIAYWTAGKHWERRSYLGRLRMYSVGSLGAASASASGLTSFALWLLRLAAGGLAGCLASAVSLATWALPSAAVASVPAQHSTQCRRHQLAQWIQRKLRKQKNRLPAL